MTNVENETERPFPFSKAVRKVTRFGSYRIEPQEGLKPGSIVHGTYRIEREVVSTRGQEYQQRNVTGTWQVKDDGALLLLHESQSMRPGLHDRWTSARTILRKK